MSSLIVIAHNLRSSHNIGSLLRTAEGLGVNELYLTGYTPYPIHATRPDDRLPHLAARTDRQIAKTALGAERFVRWQHHADIYEVLQDLRQRGYNIGALEQSSKSIDLAGFRPPDKFVLIIGNEVQGVEPDILEFCDIILEIPMAGQKESFNVVQAAAMALYQLQLVG